MVSHSSSASFSSLSFSRTSHSASTSSSSSTSPSSPQSLPSSSPHSATLHNSTYLLVASTTTPDQTNCGVSLPQRQYGTSASSASAIVPFSWEEKPGVIKKEIMQTSSWSDNHAVDEHGDSPPPLSANRDELNMCTHIGSGEGDPDFLDTSHKHATTASKLPKTCSTDDNLPRIRPPPCLSHAELHATKVEGGTDHKPGLHAGMHQHHPHRSGVTSTASARSKFMASISLQKRRHHRNSPSLEDDPFWLAMVACTNDANNGNHARRKYPKRFLSCELSRTDSRLARRLQESIHLDQCLPRQPLDNHTMSMKVHSSREHEARAMDPPTRIYGDVEDVSSVLKCSSRRVHHMQTDGHPQSVEAGAGETVHAAQLGSKAVKALSTARAELHGRCKGLLKQKSPPVVDISCSSRGGAKSKRGVGSKHRQLPDLFGCKSTHDLILVSRFP